MVIPVELSPEEIKQIKELTRLENDAEAISKAARDYLRLRKLRELKMVSGKVDFDENWKELEALESSEDDFPT